MAKLVDTVVDSRKIISYYPLWRIVLIGFVLGLLQWCFTALISQYTNSSTIPSDISTILIATIGAVVLVRLEIRQPLIIVVAVAISLWGINRLTSGLVVTETALWCGLLYSMGYMLFSWIARYKKFIPAIISIVIAIVVARFSALV